METLIKDYVIIVNPLMVFISTAFAVEQLQQLKEDKPFCPPTHRNLSSFGTTIIHRVELPPQINASVLRLIIENSIKQLATNALILAKKYIT